MWTSKFFLTQELLSRAEYLVWDLESCSTTLNIIIIFPCCHYCHEYSISSDTKSWTVLYTSLKTFLGTLNLWPTSLKVYNFKHLHITFLGTLDQFSLHFICITETVPPISKHLTGTRKQCRLHLDTLNNYKYEPMSTTI